MLILILFKKCKDYNQYGSQLYFLPFLFSSNIKNFGLSPLPGQRVQYLHTFLNCCTVHHNYNVPLLGHLDFLFLRSFWFTNKVSQRQNCPYSTLFSKQMRQLTKVLDPKPVRLEEDLEVTLTSKTSGLISKVDILKLKKEVDCGSGF